MQDGSSNSNENNCKVVNDAISFIKIKKMPDEFIFLKLYNPMILEYPGSEL